MVQNDNSMVQNDNSMVQNDNNMSRKELVVSALENGTVLDHIPAENVYKALEILNLKGIENQITIGINLASKAQGKKGIIKIEDKFFEDDELNKLALIAPGDSEHHQGLQGGREEETRDA